MHLADMDDPAPHLQHGKLSRERLYWHPSLSAERMRWKFFVYGQGQGRSRLKALCKELAHLGYYVSKWRGSRRYGQTLMVIAVMKQLDFRQLCAEVHRVRAASDRLGLLGLDCVDAENPAYDDLSVN